MKASDSATSLTGLTESEKVCFICRKGPDEEHGLALVESKTFSSCGCLYLVHPTCWSSRAEARDHPICLSCEAPIRPWLAQAQLTTAEEEERAARAHRDYIRTVGFGALAAATLFSFVIYFTVA